MQTENLQEMIKTDIEEEVFGETSLTWKEENELDFPTPVLDSRSHMVWDDPGQTNSLLFPTTETELIPQQSANEQELIAYTKFLHARMAISTVQCYWLIGKSILSFYKGKYGTGELQKISEATGIGRDTLTKACKFARQYTEEQVRDILKGKFVLSWFELARSLTVAPQNLIATYQVSSSPSEFHNAIIKLKPPAPKRPKEISSTISERIQVGEDASHGPQDPGNFIEINNDHASSSDKEISSHLEAEISDLKSTIAERDGEIAELKNLLEKKGEEMIAKDEAIDSLRGFLAKVRINMETKTPHPMVYEMISNEEWGWDKKFGYLDPSYRRRQRPG